MGFLVGLRLLQSGELAFGQDQAILRHPGLQGLQPLRHGVEVVANPDAADAGGRDPKAFFRQLVGHPRVSPGRLLHRQLEDASLHCLGHPVLRVRHPARHLDQRCFTTFFVKIPEPIETVAGKPHDPARLADAAELLRQLQHADLVADDLLVPRHRVVSSLRYSMSTLGDDTLTIAPCRFGLSGYAHVNRSLNQQCAPCRRTAIQRERNLKHWPRAWKVRLILGANPAWDDLYDRLA